MATSTVRLEFMCPFGEKQFTHNRSIARSPVTEANRAEQDGEYNERFSQVMMPLMKEHEAACRNASGDFCESYGQFATDILQNPISFLAHRLASHCGLGNVSMWKSAVRDRGNAARGRGSR
ncbi:hypothetical protein X797_012028 [Metarhizium robertsii]|uniref:Uncharacterized protein n=1 Tax=Metarhizium robertsii TaxID=568076 RepID=A0A014N5D6_9HYPO|nr:hypothetical protein X797_012028 [Metarhizium robertsii]